MRNPDDTELGPAARGASTWVRFAPFRFGPDGGSWFRSARLAGRCVVVLGAVLSSVVLSSVVLSSVVLSACDAEVHAVLLEPIAVDEVIATPTETDDESPQTDAGFARPTIMIPLEAGAEPWVTQVDGGAALPADDGLPQPMDGPMDERPHLPELDASSLPPLPPSGGEQTEAGEPPVQEPSQDDDQIVEAAVPVDPQSVLVHHYDFEGEGIEVTDRVGDAHGEIVGGALLDGVGGVVLDGVDDYVNLPNGLISVLDEMTLTIRVTWAGGVCWQRLFDIGSSFEGEDAASAASTSVFVTPSSCGEAHIGPVRTNALTSEFHVFDSTYVAQGLDPLPVDESAHVALVVAHMLGVVLYMNGEQVADSGALIELSDIIDENVWLGRSQWAADALFAGRIEDFRVYSAVLSNEQIAELAAE